MALAAAIGRTHIGRTLTIHPSTDTGPVEVTGVLRRLRMDTAHVWLSLEVDGDAGDEWELTIDQRVEVVR